MVQSSGTSLDAVWKGRPSIGVYVLLYGILAAVSAAIFVGLEVWTADQFSAIKSVFFASLNAGPLVIPYALEVVTVLIVLIAFLAKLIGLVLYRAGHSFELHTDGIYVNRGIANLQNTFISAMAFSDAKLIQTLGMRVVRRSTIIIEANDGRRFEMRMLREGTNVQSMIRNNLSHPTVRVDRQ
jgi:hypothetical protein